MENSAQKKKRSVGFGRCIGFMSPVRVLSKATDLYVNSMLGCASFTDWSAVGGTAGYAPVSFQFSPSTAAEVAAAAERCDNQELFKGASTANCSRHADRLNASAGRAHRSFSSKVAENGTKNRRGTGCGARISGAVADDRRHHHQHPADFNGVLLPANIAPARKGLGARNRGFGHYCTGGAPIGTIYEDKPSDFSGELGHMRVVH